MASTGSNSPEEELVETTLSDTHFKHLLLILSLKIHFEQSFKYRQREDDQAKVPLGRNFKVRILVYLRFQQLRHLNTLNPEECIDFEAPNP